MIFPTTFRLNSISYKKEGDVLWESTMEYLTVDGDADEQFTIPILAYKKVVSAPGTLHFVFERTPYRRPSPKPKQIR